MMPGILTYLSYFVLGLGLNLTPCIYPMLTITLSVFRNPKDESRWNAFRRAFLYVCGIVAMYTFLGVLAAFTGQLFGSLLQNSWVLLLISLFIFILSFSMLGFYTFRIPSWLMPQQGVSRQSLFGLFLSGILVGVIAAPCMGPVVLSLLAHISQDQDPIFGALSFFMLALGLGTPYLILGTFTGLLKKLPRSGAWLVWFERVLGVVLLTFGSFYLIIALRLSILPWLVPTACWFGGIYLGWVERSAETSKKFLVFKRLIGSLIAVIGFFMMMGMIGLHPKSGVVWEPYRAGVLEDAREKEQPVILDFYADWCISCHELDRFTYSDPEVIRILNAFRRIKVDATSMDSRDVQQVVRRFDVFGLPTVVFLDEQGHEVPEIRVDGAIPAKEFIAMLRSSRLRKFTSPPEPST